MTIDMMGPLLPSLAKTRQVIAVEPQGHGHTADIDRPLTYEHMADDIAALITYLELERADVFGFSMGGGIALQTAIRHPDVVRKLVVASSPFRSDGEYPEIRALEASFHPDAPMLSPMRDAYVRSAPRPEDWPRLIAKIKQSLAEDCDWTELVGGDPDADADRAWGRRHVSSRACSGDVWTARRWHGDKRDGRSPACPARHPTRDHPF